MNIHIPVVQKRISDVFKSEDLEFSGPRDTNLMYIGVKTLVCR